MRSLPIFVLQRLLSLVAVLVAVSALTFLTLHLLRPEAFGDPRSLPVELFSYLKAVFLHYDFGQANDARRTPVSSILNEGIPVDLSLIVGGLVVGVTTGLAAGAYCAARKGTLRARALEALGTFLFCAPVYWLGLMIILGFDSTFGFVAEIPGFSTNNYVPLASDPAGWVGALIVPWIVLGAPLFGLCLRMTQSAMVEVLDEDYLRTAQAKGLTERTILRRHALPAASSPVMAVVGVNMATVVTNMILVERAFSLPGVFGNATKAMDDGDFMLLQGLTLWAAVFVVVGNAAVDVLHARVDPLVRARGAR